MTEKIKNEIIKDFEDRVNNKINTLYDMFYIQPYRSSNPNKYGVIFNGNQIALCESLKELEQVINTIIFFLEGGSQKNDNNFNFTITHHDYI